MCDEQEHKDRTVPVLNNKRSDGKGDCSCFVCPSNHDLYTDVDGIKGCCVDSQTKWSFNKKANKGYCCPKGDHYSVHFSTGEDGCCPDGKEYFYDSKAGKGSCCPAETTVAYQEGRCVPKAQPPPPVQSCGTRVCENKEKKNLGLRFGSCYRILNDKGEPFVRPAEHRDYTFATTGLNLAMYHFRICRTNRDCSHDDYLEKSDSFYLHDEVGVRDLSVATARKADFVTITGGPGGKKQYDKNDNIIPTSFRLLPMCISGQCGYCMSSANSDFPGLAETCPKGVGLYENSAYCVPVFVESFPCQYELWKDAFGSLARHPVLDEDSNWFTAIGVPSLRKSAQETLSSPKFEQILLDL